MARGICISGIVHCYAAAVEINRSRVEAVEIISGICQVLGLQPLGPREAVCCRMMYGTIARVPEYEFYY